MRSQECYLPVAQHGAGQDPLPTTLTASGNAGMCHLLLCTPRLKCECIKQPHLTVNMVEPPPYPDITSKGHQLQSSQRASASHRLMQSSAFPTICTSSAVQRKVSPCVQLPLSVMQRLFLTANQKARCWHSNTLYMFKKPYLDSIFRYVA